jgi:CspA family cold shock protein
MLTATVKSWSDEEGWGALVAPEIGEDIWVHFSAIDGLGYRELVAGQAVMCEIEDLGGPLQDGYRFPRKPGSGRTIAMGRRPTSRADALVEELCMKYGWRSPARNPDVVVAARTPGREAITDTIIRAEFGARDLTEDAKRAFVTSVVLPRDAAPQQDSGLGIAPRQREKHRAGGQQSAVTRRFRDSARPRRATPRSLLQVHEAVG